MVIRVLSRHHLHRILIRNPPIPLRKFQSLSTPLNLRQQFPSEPRDSARARFDHQIAIAVTLQRYGFPQSQLHEFIRKNRFLSDSTSSDVKHCINVLLSFGLTQKSLLSILFNCHRALELGFVDEWKLAVLESLGVSTVSSSLISTVLEQSERFGIEPKDFSRNALIMKKSLGFRDETVIRVFEELPAAFMKEPIDVGRRVELLRSFGFKKEEVNGICHNFPMFLAYHVEGRLRPLFQEFRDLGFSQNEIRSVLLDDPKLVLGLEVGEISRCLELITSLKCRVPIKEKILSNGRLRGGIDVKLRIDFLCKYGLIRRDAFKVLYLEPRPVMYELEDIEKKIDFLIQKMGFTIEHLVEFPEFLGVNLEKHIIPRFKVIQHLKLIGGLCFPVGLKHLVRLSRLKFYNLYVKPYPECERIFGGVVREKEVRPRHPPGLWKMFTPPKYSDSKEDVKNMKLFVKSLV